MEGISSNSEMTGAISCILSSISLSDVNECASGNPCANGGTCVNTLGSYTCRCPAGTSGKNCDKGRGIITENANRSQ